MFVSSIENRQKTQGPVRVGFVCLTNKRPLAASVASNAGRLVKGGHVASTWSKTPLYKPFAVRRAENTKKLNESVLLRERFLT